MSVLTVNEFFASIFNAVPSSQKSERNIEITRIYFGIDGQGGSSMEATGQSYGLTRESVRQIARRVCRDVCLDESIDWTPLDACIETIQALAPCSAEHAEIALQEKGLVCRPFMIEGIINAAIAFKRTDNSVFITKLQDTRFVVTKKTESWPKRIMSAATKRVSHNGAVSVDQLSKSLRGLTKEHRDTFARNVIDSVEAAVWVGDESQSWAYFGDKGRNRFLSRINKIFSVASEVGVDEIEDAIGRSWRKNLKPESMVLPRDVMLNLLRQVDGLKVTSSDVVKVVKPELFTEELRPFEKKLFDMIRSSDDQNCREKSLEDALVHDISEKHSFSMALNYSPVILKVRDSKGKHQRGLYTVIGAKA